MPSEFPTLVAAIRERQREYDVNGLLTPTYHLIELVGEAGELANTWKKLERERLGLPGTVATNAEFIAELSDILICALKLADSLGVDLESAAREKFNKRSEELGFTTRVSAEG